MTTTRADDKDARTVADPTLETDLAELREALVGQPFPAQQDDLIAACLVLGLPARLCCRLSRLDRTHTFATLDEVCAAVTTGGPPPPRR